VPVTDQPADAPATPHAAADARTQQALRSYVKLLRAAKAWLARVEPRLAANGFTATQLGVLEAILHRGPLTQRDLGRKVLTSAGNLTDVIDKLEARGLVARTRSRADRRVVHVDLTPAGRKLITALFPSHAADIAGATDALSVAELVLLGDLLRRLGRGAQAVPLEESADAA
jgi:MarR family 2-MHQ and catechol resistance regulon transcriptional repressor